MRTPPKFYILRNTEQFYYNPKYGDKLWSRVENYSLVHQKIIIDQVLRLFLINNTCVQLSVKKFLTMKGHNEMYVPTKAEFDFLKRCQQQSQDVFLYLADLLKPQKITISKWQSTNQISVSKITALSQKFISYTEILKAKISFDLKYHLLCLISAGKCEITHEKFRPYLQKLEK